VVFQDQNNETAEIDAACHIHLSQLFLASEYMEIGSGIVPMDLAEADKWIRKAAEQGFADAPFMMGAAYLTRIIHETFTAAA